MILINKYNIYILYNLYIKSKRKYKVFIKYIYKINKYNKKPYIYIYIYIIYK